MIIQRIISMMASKAVGNTYATFDPANTGNTITLSGGNLIATQTFGSQFTRSTIGKSSGKWYWEITITSAGITTLLGIVNATASSATEFVGSTTNGWGYAGSSGDKINGAGLVVYGSTYTTGDVIGVALDMGAGTIIFYKNNVSQGTAFTGLSGTMYAAVTPNTGGASGVATANFGATALTYSPPVGYNAGLYN